MERPVDIEPMPEHLTIRLTDERVSLPSQLKSRIDAFWQSLMDDGNSFTRGDVYAIREIYRSSSKVEIELHCTDYAHYLYSMKHRLQDSIACRVIYPAALIKTQDGQFVFGEMASHTANPGRLQFAAGGIDRSDMNGKVVDLFQNVCREVKEELNIELSERQEVLTVNPKYIIKYGGPYNSVAVIYVVELARKAVTLQHDFAQYRKRLLLAGQQPELKSLVFVPADPTAVRDFCEKDRRAKVDYLLPVRKREAGL